MSNQIKFDNKAVQQFMKETAKSGGDPKKIDTPREISIMANYLETNKANMSGNDISIFNNMINNQEAPAVTLKEPAVNVSGDNNVVNKGDVNVNFGGNLTNGNGQVAIGVGNKQNMEIVNNQPPTTQPQVTPEPEHKDDNPPVSKSTNPEPPKTDKPPIDKSRNNQEEYKYEVSVNLQPGSNIEFINGKPVNTGSTKDLNYIKKSIIAQIRNFALGDAAKIIAEVNACTTQEEVVACLNRNGIGIGFVY